MRGTPAGDVWLQGALCGAALPLCLIHVAYAVHRDCGGSEEGCADHAAGRAAQFAAHSADAAYLPHATAVAT
jgi:hypothetical protein